MDLDRANDLKAFRDFVDTELSAGAADLTLDEALARWQFQNAPEAEREETLRTLQLGLDDMHAGRTVDGFAFVSRMRQKLQSAGECGT